MIDELRTVIHTVGDLPPMPPVAARVMELASNSNAGASELAEVIYQDPAVTARILKIANSSFYCLSRQVKTLDHAIVVLGQKTMCTLVLASSMKGLHQRFGLTEKMLWEDAIGCAAASRLLALRLGTASGEEAFLGGLLRNLGKLIMNNQDPARYQRMMEDFYDSTCPLEEVERRHFPFSHMLIGAAVLSKWKLPEEMAYVVRYYLDPVRQGDDSQGVFRLLGTVNIADSFCRKLGVGRRAPDEEIDFGTVAGVRSLSLDPEAVEEVFDEFRDVFAQARDTLLG